MRECPSSLGGVASATAGICLRQVDVLVDARIGFVAPNVLLLDEDLDAALDVRDVRVEVLGRLLEYLGDQLHVAQGLACFHDAHDHGLKNETHTHTTIVSMMRVLARYLRELAPYVEEQLSVVLDRTADLRGRDAGRLGATRGDLDFEFGVSELRVDAIRVLAAGGTARQRQHTVVYERLLRRPRAWCESCAT